MYSKYHRYTARVLFTAKYYQIQHYYCCMCVVSGAKYVPVVYDTYMYVKSTRFVPYRVLVCIYIRLYPIYCRCARYYNAVKKSQHI